MTKKSIFGLSENIAGLLCYVLTFFSGIVILILEKENKFVRFHALQSTIWFVFLSVLGWVLNVFSHVPLLGFFTGVVASVVGLVSFVSWIYLMYMAFKGNTYKLPVIGDVVWNQINK